MDADKLSNDLTEEELRLVLSNPEDFALAEHVWYALDADDNFVATYKDHCLASRLGVTPSHLEKVFHEWRLTRRSGEHLEKESKLALLESTQASFTAEVNGAMRRRHERLELTLARPSVQVGGQQLHIRWVLFGEANATSDPLLRLDPSTPDQPFLADATRALLAKHRRGGVATPRGERSIAAAAAGETASTQPVLLGQVRKPLQSLGKSTLEAAKQTAALGGSSMKKLATLPAQHHTKGTVLFEWHPQGIFLATCGQNRIVNIFDRQGEAQAELPLPGQGSCLQLCWDMDGDLLAVLQSDSSIIKLWDSNTKQEVAELDTGMKDLTLISWAVAGPQLAVGNAKGDLVVYNKRTLRKQLIKGKHTRKISCGAWNSENKLALGSEDRQVTISNHEGDTLHQNTLKQVPGDVQFAKAAAPKGGAPGGSKDTTLSVVLGGRSLLLYDVAALDRTPVELAFQAKYGNLVTYRWFGDGYIALGFESGYLVVMSSHQHQLSEELFSQRLHDGRLTALALSPMLQRGATCAGNTIKVVDFSDEYRELPEEAVVQAVVLDYEQGQLEHMAWTADGQILTVSSDSGCVYNFLACLPVLAEACGTRYMYLTSLLELSVCSATADRQKTLTIRISMEPTFVALGPAHAALGMNNHVYFHDLTERGCPEVANREYLGTVEAVRLNREYVAVLTEGRVHLHQLSDAQGGRIGDSGFSRVFPEGDEADVTSLALTRDFLIYATRRGTLTYFYLPDLAQINEFRHDRAITKIFPNDGGARCLGEARPASAAHHPSVPHRSRGAAACPVR